MRDFFDEFGGPLVAWSVALLILVATAAMAVGVTTSIVRDSRAMDSCMATGRAYHDCKILVDDKKPADHGSGR